MKFEAVPISEAEGLILGHNITNSEGRRVLRKGKPITAENVVLLQTLGHKNVYIAKIEPGDIAEDRAATRIAQAVCGPNIRLSGAATGRVNLYAQSLGVLRVDIDKLLALNNFAGVTLATLISNTAVTPGKMVATLKIIPYALPGSLVEQAEEIGLDQPLVQITPLIPKRVSVILSGSAASEDRVRRGFEPALADRLGRLEAVIIATEFIPLEDESGEIALAQAIREQRVAGSELIILAGETAIMDRYDIAPRAVERAGGEVTCFGAPVDPGNLLMLGYLENIPIIGAPGCVRSPKFNIIDLILPRLLVGDRLTHADIIALGHGGLLEDVPERPLPRSKLI